MEKENRLRGKGLKGFILSQIGQRGSIPFSQFMEWCLYHPEYGYYRSQGVKTGKNGDYYTSPCVHPLFGQSIAKQLFQMADILGGESFDVVEMGGGRGFLCLDILDWTKNERPSFYQRLRYYLLETAPRFLGEQKEKLSRYEKEGRVFWLAPENFKKGTAQIEGCFLSNELVDAFPAHRVVLDQGHLKELYVTHENGQFEEKWDEPSDPRISTYFESMDITLQEGQKAEVNLDALDWIEKVGYCVKKGFVLTIDYGYVAKELYSPYRPDGTLLCYFQHRISENPYERLGEQDITSHVNFTSLMQKGEEVDLSLTRFLPQYRFLMGLGILQEMETLGKERPAMEGLKLRLSLKHLIEPEAGMGEVFKVLIQHKGIDTPRLDGLRELSSIPW